MKKIILFFLFCSGFFILNTAKTNAQTLQFSRVLLVDNNGATVPTDKIWKINGILPSSRLTTALCHSSTSCSSSNTQHIIKVNGVDIYWASSDISGSSYMTSYTAIFTNQIIWLPEGTTLAAGTGVYRISVMEFTVVP